MFSMAPNILLAPNMTQNAERKHRTQDTNTAHFRTLSSHVIFPMHHIPYTSLFPKIVNSDSASRIVSLLYYFDSSSVTVPCLPKYANLHCLKD